MKLKVKSQKLEGGSKKSKARISLGSKGLGLETRIMCLVRKAPACLLSGRDLLQKIRSLIFLFLIFDFLLLTSHFSLRSRYTGCVWKNNPKVCYRYIS